MLWYVCQGDCALVIVTLNNRDNMNNDQLYFPKNFCTPCMFKTNSVYITIFQSISGTFPLISILTTYLLRVNVSVYGQTLKLACFENLYFTNKIIKHDQKRSTKY